MSTLKSQLDAYEGREPISFNVRQLGIHPLSRNRLAKIFRQPAGEDNPPIDYFGTIDFPEFPPGEDDRFHRVNPGETERLDIVSNKVYGTYRLWWLIAFVNDIANPLEDLQAGTILRIPSRRRIIEVLESPNVA